MIEDFHFELIPGARHRILLEERDDFLSFATRLGEIGITSFGPYLHYCVARLSSLATWRYRRGWFLGTRLMAIHHAEYRLIDGVRAYPREIVLVERTVWGKKLGKTTPDFSGSDANPPIIYQAQL